MLHDCAGFIRIDDGGQRRAHLRTEQHRSRITMRETTAMTPPSECPGRGCPPRDRGARQCWISTEPTSQQSEGEAIRRSAALCCRKSDQGAKVGEICANCVRAAAPFKPKMLSESSKRLREVVCGHGAIVPMRCPNPDPARPTVVEIHHESSRRSPDQPARQRRQAPNVRRAHWHR